MRFVGVTKKTVDEQVNVFKSHQRASARFYVWKGKGREGGAGEKAG